MPETVCLCTYTYNDAELTLELMRSVASWTRRPNEIVIVDDGSAKPFPDARIERVRVLRIPINSGPAKAKAYGLSACQGDIILSMDCDIRLDPEWLEHCLPSVREPDVGIVGSPVLNRAGKGLVAEYMAEFDNHQPRQGEVDLLTGGLWLMRREVWTQVGGLGRFAGRTHEDRAFCKRVREAGLKLMNDTHMPAKQVRRLSRFALVKRLWSLLGPAYLAAAEQDGGLEAACSAVLGEVRGRIVNSLQKGRPLLVYVDMLFMAHAFLKLCALADERDLKAPAAADLRLALERFLDACPKLWAFLQDDLFRLDHRPAMSGEATEPDAWIAYLHTLQPLLKAGTLSFLELQGVPALAAEERSERHYSFYEEM
ncbi:glycosyl transferase [Desulfocurvibacter africanus PCS]|uniref:Glycosyl transferase n=1 Tax=Desulfocurvibacter africanus PCS TaxID=1262666 RepID=M5PT49_DESAF|nr:glycosyltransferase family 2 protein [Desulfocurvibacter africanus]EMG37299.1 glycosyl transferase [Desulfocurvibacter africanus PCS]